MNIISALGIILVAAVLSVILRQYKAEYAVAVSVAAGAIIFSDVVFSVLKPLLTLRDLAVKSGVDSRYFSIALKALGICLITGLISDICNDFGQTALGNFAKTAARSVIFIMSVPLLCELLDAALRFIG